MPRVGVLVVALAATAAAAEREGRALRFGYTTERGGGRGTDDETAAPSKKPTMAPTLPAYRVLTSDTATVTDGETTYSRCAALDDPDGAYTYVDMQSMASDCQVASAAVYTSFGRRNSAPRAVLITRGPTSPTGAE